MLVWSAPFDAAGDRAEPVGAFYVRWHEPDERHATIWRFERDGTAGGPEAEIRRGAAILGGLVT